MTDKVDRSWPGPRTSVPDDLAHALASALNRFSAENGSNTPDFILAEFLLTCLAAWNQASRAREAWFGQALSIGAPQPAALLHECAGWLTADIPELHAVEVPRLKDSLDRFLARRMPAPTPAEKEGQ